MYYTNVKKLHCLSNSTYRIRANKRPAAYKNIRVLWWWLIAVFAQKCPKKPQKGDFWPKKVVAYWNFRVVVA